MIPRSKQVVQIRTTVLGAVASAMFMLAGAQITWAGQARDPLPANVGQVDLVNDWSCPVTIHDGQPRPLIFTTFPLSVSLTTTGGPVLLFMTTETYAGNNGATITLIPQADHTDMGPAVEYGSADGVTYTRIVMVPAGTHTFGAMIACLSGWPQHIITQAWLTVYELPMVAR